MTKNFQSPFAPKSLKDFAFNNPASKQTIYGIVNGAVPFPGNKCAICLHGAYGTGKTTLAKMLPTLLEASGFLPTFPRHNVFHPYNWEHFTKCGLAGNTVAFSQAIAQRVHDHMLAGPTGWHYEILDEVDLLTTAAQASLKSLMDPSHGTIFILTTNHPNLLDKGVVNRSHMIEMNYPNLQQYQAIATSWLIQEGFTGNEVTAAQWATIIAGCKGFRDLGDAVATIIKKLQSQPPVVV